MSRSKRKRKKTNKQARSPTIVSPLRKTVDSTPLPPDVTRIDPKKALITSKGIFTNATAELCFGTFKQQLEKSQLWDPMIISAWLISNSRGQTGAISQLVLNVDGRTFSSQVVTFRYRPNDSISWVSRGKPKVREDWRLESKSNGTIMHIDFAIELDGWPIRRYFFKVLRQKKVENNLDRMLVRLKETVESTSQN